MRVYLDALNAVPPAIGHKSLQGRSRPMQAHVPVAMAMLGFIFLKDGATDTCLAQALSEGKAGGACKPIVRRALTRPWGI